MGAAAPRDHLNADGIEPVIATDVSKLLDLARNRTAEGRSALVSAIGDLIVTGPTSTNVADIQIMLMV